jgi:hypothetical protein
MTKRELEAMVSGVKSPPLDRKQTRKLFEENSNIEFQQDNHNQVAQTKPQRVAQPVAQRVAQPVAQRVAQPVAQFSWVAQGVAKQVAQNKPQKVAQNRPQKVAQDRPQRIKDSEELLIEKDVNKLKDQIFQIQGVDKRKSFVREIGWGIMTEKRGKKQYLFGVKKLGGRKYKLYIGNATN